MTDIKENPPIDKLQAVKLLLEVFKIERYVYIGMTILSILVLFGVGFWQISHTTADDRYIVFAGLLAPTGVLTLSVSRLLTMWNQALKFINNETNITA